MQGREQPRRRDSRTPSENYKRSELSPLHRAAAAVALHEEYSGYSDFKAIAEHPDPQRIEFKLGELMADIAAAIARAYIEHADGGLKPDTKEKCSVLLVELFQIYWASSFKSFNAERGVWEPYFSNAPADAPRMIFPEAALHYGVYYMEQRFPKTAEATLKAVLSWVLKILDNFIMSLFPPMPRLPQ